MTYAHVFSAIVLAGLLHGPFGLRYEALERPPHEAAVLADARSQGRASDLELVQHVADSTAFNVNSVLIVGPTEALLIDAQYHARDAHLMADKIEETGVHLKAVFITHPDHDHFGGAAVIAERFPGTPVYMTAAALHHFESVGVADFQRDKVRLGDLLADSVVVPQVLPSTTLEVDGETVEIIPGLQGDVLEPVNSVVWVPSLGTLITGDLVFNGVHAWLGASDAATRAAWRASLQEIALREPTAVVAGHKPTVDTPDDPAAIQNMIDYLADFDDALVEATDGAALAETMRRKYPWKVDLLLRFSARRAVERR